MKVKIRVHRSDVTTNWLVAVHVKADDKEKSADISIYPYYMHDPTSPAQRVVPTDSLESAEKIAHTITKELATV